MSEPSYPQPPAGQQPPPPGWGAPPAAPKKSNAGKIVGFGCLGFVGFIVVVGIIGAVVGGGSDSATPTATKQTASSSAKKSDAPAKDTADDQAPAGPEDDVKITACEVDSALRWPSAKLTITNRSSKTSNYMVQLEFVDAKGTRISEGIAATNNLAPGQAAKETAQGTAEAEGKITCKVTEVTRYAS